MNAEPWTLSPSNHQSYRYGVPTATYIRTKSADEAKEYIKKNSEFRLV